MSKYGGKGLPYKFLAWSKMIVFADDKIIVFQNVKFVPKRVEMLWEKAWFLRSLKVWIV